MPEPISEPLLARRFIKERLQRDRITFHSHESEWKNVHDLLERTAEVGESNSLLLIGPRGSGKTTLVNSVLYSLLPKKDFQKNTLIVQLNGLVHTDDRLALKAATVQMNLENATDGKVFGSFAENLAFLLACLKSGNKKSKSVIFILEEFDLFCSHHNQTLLYNLFDVSQSAQAPLCVLGITCRLDVIELLEKRVKSRFSHRQVFLFPSSDDFESRIELFKQFLRLPSEKELKALCETMPNPKEMKVSGEFCFLRNHFNPSKYSFSKKFVDSWNKHINELALNTTVRTCLQNVYDFDVSEAFFKIFLFKIVAQINDSHPTIKSEDISQICTVYESDDKVQLMCGLSVLELCLIITMKHHSEIYDRDPFNFEIIFSRFMKFAKISSTMQGVERSVVLKAFEHLRNLEFIMPLSSIACKVQKEFEMHKMALTYGQIGQAVNKYQALPTEVAQWAQSSLI
ncbi:origin recognition complex subunit 4 [Episyrphus balteatus]|uniref:origin recognition complex subunit 4 n=1 Tax=Episyrphus balteatus TaxID=286459 RepID=UPI0024867F2B|nr:origin recognition complex subunit 4 [Episyrphus balteatus]